MEYGLVRDVLQCARWHIDIFHSSDMRECCNDGARGMKNVILHDLIVTTNKTHTCSSDEYDDDFSPSPTDDND